MVRLGDRQAEAATKKSGGEPAVEPSPKEVVAASDPYKPTTAVKKAPKRKATKDSSPEKIKKKLRIVTLAKKKKTTEGEDITKVDLHSAEVPGLLTLYFGSTVIPPKLRSRLRRWNRRQKRSFRR